MPAYKSLLDCPTANIILSKARKKYNGILKINSPRAISVIQKDTRYPKELYRLWADVFNNVFYSPNKNLVGVPNLPRIKQELSEYNIPKPIEYSGPKVTINGNYIEQNHLFNIKEQLIAIQTMHFKDSKKIYIMWSYWGKELGWIKSDPGTLYPLYVPAGIDELKSARCAFIHEGAKAARAGNFIANGKTPHPWKRFLKQGIHLGYIGGTYAVKKTDWNMIKHIEKLYIIPDNDFVGRKAVKDIARLNDIPTYQINFDHSFPKGFDLADAWPKGNNTLPNDIMNPATWIDNELVGYDDKPFYTIRESATKTWAYIEQIHCLICPEISGFKVPIKNAKHSRYIAPFVSSKKSIDKLPFEDIRPIDNLDYLPGRNERVIHKTINTWNPTSIKPNKTSADLFLEFLEYLVPNQTECYELLRWICTLIARPSTRIGYGILLISRQQGIGKTTLGEQILTPLLGEKNVSFPRGNDFNSDFNSWCVNKQLAFVNEIYEGKGWSTYHKLKTIITDKYITVSEKFIPNYTVQNWCHIMACSNSIQALKIQHNDRRWFIPTLIETRWNKYGKLYNWIQNGKGLGAIMNYAINFEDLNKGKFIHQGEHAPDSRRKREIVSDSLSEVGKECIRISNLISEQGGHVCILQTELKEYLIMNCNKVYETRSEIEHYVLRNEGVILGPTIKAGGYMQKPFLNKYTYDSITDSDKRFIKKPSITTINDLIPDMY